MGGAPPLSRMSAAPLLSHMSAAPRLVVVATSARALAAAARRAGYAPLAVDAFADLDTRALCEVALVARRAGTLRLSRARLLDAVRALAREHAPVGLVYGAGMEGEPGVLDALAALLPVLGNGAETVRRVKDPQALTAFCAAQGVSHPQTSLSAPADPAGWLVKPRGGAGGFGVRPAAGAAPSPRRYFQRRLDGESLSALFVADGRAARVLGWSAQWADPAPGAPFRYGGAVGPVAPAPAVAASMRRAVEAAAAHFGLRGLCSADFIATGDDAALLELNPRPGATLDVFDAPDDPLLRRHIAACRGDVGPTRREGLPRAAQVVYARADGATPAATDWPDWAADRPPGGATVRAQEPLCTVIAQARDTAGAVERAGRRAARVVELMEGAST